MADDVGSATVERFNSMTVTELEQVAHDKLPGWKTYLPTEQRGELEALFDAIIDRAKGEGAGPAR